MFAALHQEQQRRPHRRAVEDSPSVISSPEGGNLPGAYAEGRRNGQEVSDDSHTISPQESVAPVQERRDQNNELLLTAVAVDENKPPDDTPVFEAEEKQDFPWFTKRKNQCIMLAFLLLIIGIVVAVVIPLSGGDGSGQISSQQKENASNEDTPTPTSSPSVSPAPTSFYERLFALISAYSGEEVLLDSSTPQYQAFQWTLGDFEAGDWSDDVILHRYALASLFYSTNGGQWLDITEFVIPLPYCDWDGVGCMNDTLTSLSLQFQNLAGSLPPEIGLLTSLTSMNLSNNALTGSVPTEIGFLTKLEVMEISLTENQSRFLSIKGSGSLRRSLEDANAQPSLTGPIPSEIGLVTSLLSLDLSDNEISGSIPSEVGELLDVVSLSLHGNNLSGEIPLQFGFLTHLQHLSIEKNLLSGAVPNTLCSTVSAIQELSSDCLAEEEGENPAEVVCKCCNLCCDVNDVCRDLDVTAFPSSSPSTSVPSSSPSSSPTTTPSVIPSAMPSTSPSSIPSYIPTFVPSMSPSFNPTPSGTPEPTVTASKSPSKSPTLVPLSSPSLRPTSIPTITQPIPPTVSCRIDENSCVGNRACNEAVELCTESGSCSGRNACRSATDLIVEQGSCVGM